jgi:glucose-6-phosphate isomerase
VRARVAAFAGRVRSGAHAGATGRPLTDVLSIGIGGSYLGVEFVHEALRCDAAGAAGAAGRRLRFLANVDPVDFARAVEGLDPETTLVLVVSKTFTTAETMLNARTARDWLVRGMAGKAAPAAVVAAHVAAVSTALPLVAAFGIAPENVFGFWDWVGGRYSVTSAVGVLPLALAHGPAVVDAFLAGAAEMDAHFAAAPLEANLPVTLGLLGVWNATFLGHATRALLPYSQALLRLPAHIQQVDMESNGKRVDAAGEPLPFPAGPINFGEPGTNGQHSFYQLLHQGRVVPADFVGFATSQAPVALAGEAVSSHDELMSNFFAQPDALALGKTAAEVAAEGAPPELVPHKVFPGDRPSSSLLLPALDAVAVGRLLALFEHRTAVEGFVWGICSFDQWGVELGKKLATAVRGALKDARAGAPPRPGAFTPATERLLAAYLKASAGEAVPPPAAAP